MVEAAAWSWAEAVASEVAASAAARVPATEAAPVLAHGGVAAVVLGAGRGVAQAPADPAAAAASSSVFPFGERSFATQAVRLRRTLVLCHPIGDLGGWGDLDRHVFEGSENVRAEVGGLKRWD